MASGWERGSHRRVKQACIRPYTVPSLFFAGRLREAVEGDWGHCKFSVTKLFHSAHSPTHQWYSSVLLQLSPEVLPGLGERAVEVKSTGRTVLNQIKSNQIIVNNMCISKYFSSHRREYVAVLYRSFSRRSQEWIPIPINKMHFTCSAKDHSSRQHYCS